MHKFFFMMMEKVGRVTSREGVEAEMRPKPDSFTACGATGWRHDPKQPLLMQRIHRVISASGINYQSLVTAKNSGLTARKQNPDIS